MHDTLWVGLFLVLLIGSLAYAGLCDRAWGSRRWTSTSGSPPSPRSAFSSTSSPCSCGPSGS